MNSLFADLFGQEPETHAEAHGRVNLIGEHTDYNGGHVLPTLLPQSTTTWLSRNGTSSKARLYSNNTEDGAQSYHIGSEEPRKTWIDYIQGLTWVLRRHGFTIKGYDALISSTVPSGSGVSSSAALEVSVLKALREVFRLELNDVDLALYAQESENDFVGARVGIMDQMVASVGSQQTALLLNSATREFRHVALPHKLQLAVIHSGVKHSIRAGDYNTRRAECEQAASLLGVTLLCELSEDALPLLEKLQPVLAKRARHAITENARVLKAVTALESGDLLRAGQLMNESHESLKVDYEVSIREIDHLVELARKESKVYGARITGGGFGGAIVLAVEHGSAKNIAERVSRTYSADTGRTPRILAPV